MRPRILIGAWILASLLIALPTLPLPGFMMLTGTAHADPIFTWLEPWQVSIPPAPTTGGPPNRLNANFGAGATADGQIVNIGNAGDVGAASAFARAALAVMAPPGGTKAATLSVIFSREFRLSGATFGWDVSLDGFVAGLLFNITNAATTNSSASVFANAEIDVPAFLMGQPVGIPTGIELNYKAQLENGAATTTNRGLGAKILDNGDYLATGELIVDVSESGSGQAISNFYDGRAGFLLTVNATPVIAAVLLPPFGEETLFETGLSQLEVSATLPPSVPEPTTLMLLVAGLAVLLPRLPWGSTRGKAP